MPIRNGKYTVRLPSRPVIAGYAAVAGKKEGEGPLGGGFDYIYEDAMAGEDSWEKAESLMHRDAVTRALTKAELSPEQAEIIFAGDLLDQCTGTAFGIKELSIPFMGVYGACSTMALSMAAAAMAVDCRLARVAVASTSSHFCSAEKQFRMPLEYGGQRPETSQWTATAAGAAVITNGGEGARIECAMIGKICDLGVKDANNMGAAMAPAACRTIIDFLRDTDSEPSDYDMILTGDLGEVGSVLLHKLCEKQENTDISAVHYDCGIMLYNRIAQKVNSGGSGCGCSAAVVCSDILNRINSGELKKVLFVGTGALMSSVSSLQSESIPGIAHAVLITGG